MRIFKSVLLVLLSFGHLVSIGQSVSSTYSIYGIGELVNNSLAHNQAMGGLGIGMPQRYNLNIQNPAWLSYNALTSFNVGLQMDLRNYNGDLTSGKTTTASLRSMVFSVPLLNGKWGSAFSLLPFSSVGYNLMGESVVNNSEFNEIVANNYSGSGGLTQFAWSNGFRIYQSINVGVKLAKVFGNILKSTQSQILSDTSGTNYFADYTIDETYDDMTFGFSIGKKVKIKEDRELNFGATYENLGVLKGVRNTYLSNYLNGSAQVGPAIQLQSDVSTTFDLPTNVGLGLSYSKVDKYQIGLDVNFGNWSGRQSNTDDIQLNNTTEIIVGGELTPDMRSITSYLNRVTYRFGLNFSELPYLVQENTINEFSINFGASFPVAGLSTLDLALRYGERGKTNQGLVKESFFQFVLAMTINERWFIKRKYD
ncbi:MAG: hypothetical protein HQ474_04515 [Flammeovirgaceae bacterium]|jgi:hypothetical protein|nr:hypothetical protein [Flammeovirgaceae bacterium]|tara:strand:- start:28633 stop:29904 length:1272 start_codon:yes stop_codon:yes gene_type:complete